MRENLELYARLHHISRWERDRRIDELLDFLGWTFFYLSQLPLALKMALYLLPLTHFSMCLRAAALGDSIPWWSLLAMSAFLLAFSLGSMRSQKERVEMQIKRDLTLP